MVAGGSVIVGVIDQLQQLRIEHRGADWLVRTDAAPSITALFRAAHVALPLRARQTAPPKPSLPPPAKKRRGRPRPSPRRLEFRRKRHKIKLCKNPAFKWGLTARAGPRGPNAEATSRLARSKEIDSL